MVENRAAWDQTPGVEIARRYIRNQKGKAMRCVGRRGGPPFGGEVLADGIDFSDGRAGADQCLIQTAGVFERDAGVEWQLKHGGAASANEEEDEVARAGALQKGQRSAGGGE